ncbi:hypothetical protein DCAR_0935184 [Daucus carota subsp. sativus]|uniref:Uncharacterized protein n=1 Tax=Daucus carota subsp. sativus TaxID=79200 RepID=A0A175YH83_DAUCS|nr:PREDICTED: cytochrome P450 CYP71D313-like [Daucus carota subsp. sativus]WOH15641.1 hypothetical protein DCAR_0935184 [Daucus carota subsp. sativus]
MEFNYPTLFITLVTIILILFKKSRTSKPKNLPPGPWKLPILGNLHQVIGPLPHRGFKELAKKHGPIMHLQLGQVSLMVVSSSKVAAEALKTNDISLADKPQQLLTEIILENCRDFVFARYGDYWRQMRKICTLEMLSVNKVKSFRSIREDESWHLIDTVHKSLGSPMNMSHMFAELSYNITCRAAIGKRGDKEVIEMVEDIAYWAAGFFINDLFPSVKFLSVLNGMKPALKKIRRKIDHIFKEIIDEHKEKLARREKGVAVDTQDEDLVDVLLRVNETQRLQFPINDNDIQAITLDMLTAGTDTSSTVLEWAMSALMKHPRVMNKAQEEVRELLKGKEKVTETDIIGQLSYLKLVIKETLRLHTPLPLLVARECRKECEIEGYTIPEKTKLLVNVWAIGRDPDRWADAEKFVPERFENSGMDFSGTNFDYLPFGAGRRMCPGINFGVAGVELPLAQLLYHFDWKVPNDGRPEDLNMEESFGTTNKRKHNLVLVPTLPQKA